MFISNSFLQSLALLASLLLTASLSADPSLNLDWLDSHQLQVRDIPTDSNQIPIHPLLPRQATTPVPPTPPVGNTNQAGNPIQNTNTPQATGTPVLNAAGTSPSPVPTSSVFSAPIDAPVGALIFTQPPAIAAASYYKIAQNQPITFGWNYTNVLSFGHSITIVAFCSLNKVSYTISTLPAQATALTWDPYALQQQPGYPLFAEAIYTLQIFDERGMGAGPTPGLMAPSSTMKFAMYKPQPYTPLASWQCTTCSGARGFFSNYSPVLLACGLSLITAIGGGCFGVLAAIR